MSASDDGRARAALQSQIDALERQHTIDLGVIADLQAEGVVDRGMIANLEIALGGARRIGAAIGILMVTRKISDEQAYELMRTTSQRQGRRLREIADDVIVAGALDDVDGNRRRE